MSDHEAEGQSSETPQHQRPHSSNPIVQQIQRSIPCRSVNCFDKIEMKGEGTYGQVFMARDKESSKIFALKRVRMEKEKEGFPVTALRELLILKRLKHPHIVNMVEVVVGTKQDSVFLVFEFCEHDLAALLDASPNPPFTEAEIKRLLLQLLDAVAYMHEQWVIHRDIKMSNLLYNRGSLKLCDFGLARDFGTPLRPYTPKVVTLWYRPPELLLGAKTYSNAIDIWACGCILGEFLAHAPVLPGRTEFEQLQMIYDLLGAPNDVIWPGYSSMPNITVFKTNPSPYNNISQRFPKLSSEGRDLLNTMMTYDPDKRPGARELLSHEYFRERPVPKSVEHMPLHATATSREKAHRKRPRSNARESEGPPRDAGKDSRFGLVF